MNPEARLRAVLLSLREHLDPVRAEQVDNLQARLTAGRLRVLLVGEAKRGKSTLGNALLGRQVLPSGVVPVTAITTTVRAGAPERLEVAGLDGSIRTAALDELTDLVTEEGNPGNYRRITAVTVLLDPQACAPVPAGSGSGWLASGLELVDTPGMGSVHLHNTAEADAALATMDAAVFVLTADPPISASELALLRRVQELSVRTYVLLNKADRLNPGERAEVARFTEDVLGRAGARLPDLFAGSALQALRARLDGDPRRWSASGLPALEQALTGQLAAARDRALLASLTRSTQRLIRQLLDETAIAARAEQLRVEHRQTELEAFRAVLSHLARRAEEALAVAAADLRRLRQALDEAAAEQVMPLTNTARERLRAVQDAADPGSAAALEDAGDAALVELIRPAVQDWRQQRAAALEAGLRAAAGRQQELLDAAVAGIRQAAQDHLGVRLRAGATPVELPDPGRYYYSFEAEIGWGAPLDAAVRRWLPGELGRRRARAWLDGQAVRLVDLHLGRARADFQSRLAAAGRALTCAVRASYADTQRRLTSALDAPARPGSTPEQARTIQNEQRALAQLAEQLDELASSPLAT